MKTIIIRDDDTSFFTSPELLEQLYGKLWKQGIPVCLAVIPAQRADVRVRHRPGHPFDPGIPPQYRGINREYSVLQNAELCRYLNEQASQGYIEICLHGYAHTYMEYLSEDVREIEWKLKRGREILQTAFPDARIATFIAPYDRISQTALQLVIKHGFNLCTNSENLPDNLALSPNRPYTRQLLPGGKTLFTCNEYLFTHHTTPENCFRAARNRFLHEELLIVANHYWTFYYDWSELSEDWYLYWNRFVDDLISPDAAQFATFSGA